MGLSKLNNLYREVILDHADHPHNKGALKDATNAITLNNPTCGDEIDLQVKVGSDGLIDEIGYTGSRLHDFTGIGVDDDRSRQGEAPRRGPGNG